MNSYDLDQVRKTFNALVELKSVTLQFYEACAQVCAEDKTFWDSVIEEERFRVKDIRALEALVLDNPDTFDLGEPFRFDITKIFIMFVINTIKRIRNGQLSKQEILRAGIHIESFSVGARYAKLIKTHDTTYLKIADEIASQVTLLQGKLTKRLRELEKSGDNASCRAIDERQLDPLVTVISVHNQFKEYVQLLQGIAVGALSDHIWPHIETVAQITKKDVMHHFQIEEQVIFSRVKAAGLSTDMQAQLMRLIEEHRVIAASFDEFENLLFTDDMNLPQDKIDKLQKVFHDFVALVSKHMQREEETVFPLYKT